MFGKLFGAKPQTQKPVVDIESSKQKLDTQIEHIELRIKKLENDEKDLKKQAIEKAKAGDKKKAAMLLRKSKMVGAELVKLEGQSIILEKQKAMIENSQFDKNVFEAMKAGKQAVDANREKLNIDEMEQIKDDIAD